MSITATLLIVLLLVVLTLASYIDRLYSEMGKFLAREFQENIDVWEQRVEPRLERCHADRAERAHRRHVE